MEVGSKASTTHSGRMIDSSSVMIINGDSSEDHGWEVRLPLSKHRATVEVDGWWCLLALIGEVYSSGLLIAGVLTVVAILCLSFSLLPVPGAAGAGAV